MPSHCPRLLQQQLHIVGLRTWTTHSPQIPGRARYVLRHCRGVLTSTRKLQTSAATRNDDAPPKDTNTVKAIADKAAAEVLASKDPENKEYVGPLTQTFRRLKIFSLSSLGLTTAMAPFLFHLEAASAVPLVGRIALVGTVLVTSSVSTMLVGWLGQPYVTTLRWLPADNPTRQPVGLEMTTVTLTLRERITRVYDSAFLVPTNRPLAKWELAEAFRLPQKELDVATKEGSLPREETVAETLDKDGKVLGRWIVKWEADGRGVCRHTGTVIRWAPSLVSSLYEYAHAQRHLDISTFMKSSWGRTSGRFVMSSRRHTEQLCILLAHPAIRLGLGSGLLCDYSTIYH